MARLAGAGLTGTPVDPADLPRRSLATFGCATVVFTTFAASIWAHLMVAWKESAPSTTPTYVAVVLMTAAMVVIAAIATVAIAPVAWTVAAAIARRRSPGLLRPVLLLLLGAAALAVGGFAFRHGWAGPGAHGRASRSTGPGGAPGFVWASTVAVSAYWAHPTILLSLPAGELAWMCVSPVALGLAVIGATRLVRRLDFSTRLLRFVGHAARAGSVALSLFLVGALVWMVDGGPGPSRLFQAGTVDAIGVAVMSVSLGLALQTMLRVRVERVPLGCG